MDGRTDGQSENTMHHPPIAGDDGGKKSGAKPLDTQQTWRSYSL